MMDSHMNIGPASTRRRIATVIGVIGVVFVASQLANAWPREVEVVYDVAPAVDELDADYLQSGSAVASVRFGRDPRKPGHFRHVVRLQPGAYRVHITLHGRDGAAVEQVRELVVPSAGLTRFDLRNAWLPPR